MKLLSNMHPVSVLVILLILALFAVSLVMLFAVCKTYRRPSWPSPAIPTAAG